MKKILAFAFVSFAFLVLPFTASAESPTETELFAVVKSMQAQIVSLVEKIDALTKEVAALKAAATVATPLPEKKSIDYTPLLAKSARAEITLVSPNGGEIMQASTTITVRWDSDYIPDAGVIRGTMIDERGVSTQIFASVQNTGFIKVMLPELSPGFYRLRLSCGIADTNLYCSPDGTLATNENAEDMSDGTFIVTSAGPIPSGGGGGSAVVVTSDDRPPKKLPETKVTEAIAANILHNLGNIPAKCSVLDTPMSVSYCAEFDLDNDGKITGFDAQTLQNIQSISDASFQILFDKIMTAAERRIGAKVGDDLPYPVFPYFDVDNSGFINILDVIKIRNALNEGRLPSNPTDADIMKNLEAAVRSHLVNFLTPADSPNRDFDLNGDNRVDGSDENLVRVMATAVLAEPNLSQVRNTLLLAVTKRLSLTSEDSRFVPQFDVDNNGTIEQADYDTINTVLPGSTTILPISNG